jgi:hypothetical protein
MVGLHLNGHSLIDGIIDTLDLIGWVVSLMKKTITISKDGSIYFYNPGWKYKFGGGLQINGKDIKPNSKIYINAKMDIISLSGGKVYIEKIE